MKLRPLVVALGESALRNGLVPRWVALFAALQSRRELRDLLRQQQVQCVLDVGANVGQFGRRLRQLGYAGRIVSFEPILEACEALRWEARNDALWDVVNIALGAEDGQSEFRIQQAASGHSVLSSFLPLRDSHPFVAHEQLVEQTRTVPLRRLDTLLPESFPDVLKQRVFLKIDTQGFDLEVVRGASSVLECVVLLQSELSVVPIYEGMPPYTVALETYTDLGFEVVGLDVVNRTASGAILECDCLMQRVST